MIEISIVFCTYGVGSESNVVERKMFTRVQEAVEWLKSCEIKPKP